MAAPASVLVPADPSLPGSADQLAAVADAVAGTDLEVVLVENGATVAEIPAGLQGRLVRARPPQRLGRRAALEAAADAATADVCLALGPLARPLPGFAAPLIDAVAGGAGLAAPALDTSAGRVHGYRAAGDGHLLPLAEPGTTADALAFDCLAGPRRFWLERLPIFGAAAGPAERQLAAAAGRLVVCADALVARAAFGPSVSVVVRADDHRDDLDACINALVAHGVLADDGEIVLEEERARHDVLAHIDADARPGPGWIETVRAAFADPRVTVAGGPVHALSHTPHAAHPYLDLLDHGDRDFRAPAADLDAGNRAVRRGAPDGLTRYAVGATVGRRLPAGRHTETWLLPRAYRTGLASGDEPHDGALADCVPAGEVTVDDALSAIAHCPATLEWRVHAARQLGVLVRDADSRLIVDDEAAAGRVAITGRFVAVASADELTADATLLADYAAAFGPGDPATLVILGTDDDLDGLVAAVAAAGLDGDDAPDLLAVTDPDLGPGILHAVFSRRHCARFGALPHVADAAALRELAEQAGHVAPRTPTGDGTARG